MYTKEEKKQLNKNFWIGFANAYPKKWLLHHTKIKDVGFKFFAEEINIKVIFEIGCRSEDLRTIYTQKIESLLSILKEDYIADIEYNPKIILENGKEVAQFWVSLPNCHFNRQTDWPLIYQFFYEKMSAFENFYYNFEDYIKDLKTNQ